LSWQWEGEGDQVYKLNHLNPLTFPRVHAGLPLPKGDEKGTDPVTNDYALGFAQTFCLQIVYDFRRPVG
jgi:hypothetical protein